MGDPEGGDGPPGARPGRRRWRWFVAGAAAAVAIASGVGFVLLDSDSDAGERAAQETEAFSAPASEGRDSDSEGLDPEGEEFVALLDAGGDLTYHATYEVVNDQPTTTSEWTLDVWRAGDRLRQDSRQVSEAGTVETADLLVEGGATVTCQRVDDAEWTCSHQHAADDLTSHGLFGTTVREIAGADVVVTDEHVAGRPARCFTVTDATSHEASQCLSPDGIPLRLRGGGLELVLSELSDDVHGGVFTPPATPEGG